MIKVLTTGGTIDKIYFDATSEYEVGESTIPHIFHEVNAHVEYDLLPVMRKDSLDINEEDRKKLRELCEASEQAMILITHGTDTMCETAEYLRGVAGKTIVLTGSLAPARFRVTDAIFNVGLAMGAVQSKPEGVYIAMSGGVFEAGKVWKNKEKGRFEAK